MKAHLLAILSLIAAVNRNVIADSAFLRPYVSELRKETPPDSLARIRDLTLHMG